MFYKKTDIEILCDALIKLSDKQEHFMEKFGAVIKSPYHDAMHAIMIQIETHFNLASGPKSPTVLSNISTVLNHANQIAKEKIEKKKNTQPATPRHYFKRSKITMGIGHSDDPGMATDVGNVVPKKAVEWAKEPEKVEEVVKVLEKPMYMETVEEVPEEVPQVIKPSIPAANDATVTVDNIDSLTKNLLDKFEPRDPIIPHMASLLN